MDRCPARATLRALVSKLHPPARKRAPTRLWLKTLRVFGQSLALCLVLLVVAGCDGPAGTGKKKGGDASHEALAPAVEAVLARAGTLPLEERLSGVVRASNFVSIRAEVAAPVSEVLVRSGEAVERGQPLVRLKDDTLRDQLRQAQASVRLEEAAARGTAARVAELDAQVKRSAALAARSLVSALEVEILEAQLEGARATAEQAAARVDLARATAEERRTALDRTVIRAPVTGRIGRRNVEVGMLVDPSLLLFELGNLDRVIVEVPLTGEMLAHVAEGQPVTVESPARGQPALRGTLARISPFLAAGSLSTTGEIDIDNADGLLYPGMFVSVDVHYGESERATLVPTSALWEDPRSGGWGVFVVGYRGDGAAALSSEAHAVTLRRIEVPAQGRGLVGVRGVEPGEWVVTVGQHLLVRGADVVAARVRPVAWERVLELQGQQREDLLREFLDHQQRLARERGARPPTTQEFLDAAGEVEVPAAPGGS
jgi:RND family efflux transporter MFP subunit